MCYVEINLCNSIYLEKTQLKEWKKKIEDWIFLLIKEKV